MSEKLDSTFLKTIKEISDMDDDAVYHRINLTGERKETDEEMDERLGVESEADAQRRAYELNQLAQLKAKYEGQ